MDRASAMAALPTAYGNVLRWRAAGLDTSVIAERLDVEPKTVALLIRVAEAKLVALLDTGPGEGTPIPRAE